MGFRGGFLLLFFLLPQLALAEAIKVRPVSGTVALTFDDGPDPRHTPQILEILERYGIKATFFIVGQRAKKMPDMVRSIQRAGHVIANHSYSHPRLTALSPERVNREIDNTDSILFEITNEPTFCVRPPYGALNKRVKSLIKASGKAVSMWDVDSLDHRLNSETSIVNLVLKAKSGDVILFHDLGQAGSRTKRVLTRVIEGLKQKGLGFDTICDSKPASMQSATKD